MLWITNAGNTLANARIHVRADNNDKVALCGLSISEPVRQHLDISIYDAHLTLFHNGEIENCCVWCLGVLTEN